MRGREHTPNHHNFSILLVGRKVCSTPDISARFSCSNKRGKSVFNVNQRGFIVMEMLCLGRVTIQRPTAASIRPMPVYITHTLDGSKVSGNSTFMRHTELKSYCCIKALEDYYTRLSVMTCRGNCK